MGMWLHQQLYLEVRRRVTVTRLGFDAIMCHQHRSLNLIVLPRQHTQSVVYTRLFCRVNPVRCTQHVCSRHSSLPFSLFSDSTRTLKVLVAESCTVSCGNQCCNFYISTICHSPRLGS